MLSFRNKSKAPRLRALLKSCRDRTHLPARRRGERLGSTRPIECLRQCPTTSATDNIYSRLDCFRSTATRIGRETGSPLAIASSIEFGIPS